MAKFLIFITIISIGYLQLIAAHGRGYGNFRGGSSEENSKEAFSRSLGTRLCTNTTVAQLFVTQTRAQIAAFAANSSFADFLQKNTQAVAYLQNASNDGLISTNCTGYFTGLQTAHMNDMTAQRLIESYTEVANNALRSIVQGLVSPSGYRWRWGH